MKIKPEATTKQVESEKKLVALTKQLAEKEAQYLRALADYQNLEKRAQERIKQETDNLTSQILKQFLTIKSDIDKALPFAQDEGLKLIKQKFQTTLTSLGVEEISVIGQPFSPDTMECIQTKPGAKDNIVLEVNESGYAYRGRLLRPARVVVSQLKV